MSKESAMAQATGVTGHVVEAKIDTPTAANAPETTSQASDPNVQALLKKEVRLVQERKAFNEEMAKSKLEIEQSRAVLAKHKEFEELKNKDVVASLKMLGYTDTQIFEALSQSAPREKTAEEKAEEVARRVLKENNDKLEVDRQKSEQEKNVKVIDNFNKSIGSAIKADPVKYEFCNFNGQAAEELIYMTVAETLKESKGTKLLTVTEAADLVEAHYEEQAKALKALKKMTPAEVVEAKKEELKKETVLVPKVGGEQPRSKTLTNKVTLTSTTNQRAETSSEKRERLAQVLRTGDTGLLRR